MAYDLIVKNGLMIDGTGAPARHADIAVENGRIAAIGRIQAAADRMIDASDCIVSPGFVDPHTHYDAQICWDPEISPSSWHGITSVVIGNCGVGIAPCRPDSRTSAMKDLVNVEGIPFEVLSKGIDWDFESFPDYLHSIARRRPTLNIGALAPLTPFRHYVMGGESSERAANADETAKIKALLKEAVSAGALGFSTSALTQHLGHDGRPLACRNASHEELRAYSSGLRELRRGLVQIALTKQVSVVGDEEHALLDLLASESQRNVSFIALIDRDDMPDACRSTLDRISPLTERGVVPQVSPLPITREVSMRSPYAFASIPTWRQVLNRGKDEQAALYRSEAFRNSFRADLRGPALAFSGNWNRVFVNEVADPAMKPYEGRTVRQIADERGKDGVDTLLDLTLEADLAIEFVVLFFNVTEDRIPYLLTDKRTMLGLSDGGAHVDALCDAGYSTHLLGKWVRDKQIMPVEEAVRRLTSQPADVFGLRDRGRLKCGLAADIVVFDPATVGSGTRGMKRYDLTGGAKRLVMPSQGIVATVINGVVAYENGALTGARAGTVLRSIPDPVAA